MDTHDQPTKDTHDPKSRLDSTIADVLDLYRRCLEASRNNPQAAAILAQTILMHQSLDTVAYRPHMNDQEVDQLWTSTVDLVADMSKGTGLWRHYKGDTVQIIGPCLDEQTGQPCVVYQHRGIVWVRTLSSWNEQVSGVDGQVPRFRPLFESETTDPMF